MDILKAADCKVKVLHVTDGKDPDEYIKKNGKQAFLELVQGALPFGDYKLESAKAGFDLTRDEDKIDYLRKSAEILRQLGPVEQDIYIKKLSQELKVAEGAIRREVDGMGGTEPQRRTFVQSEQETKSEENSSVTMLERTLLKVLITEHEYISKLSQYPGILESPFAVTIYNALADEYEQTGDVDLRRVLDSLSVSEAGVLQEIAEQTGTGGRTEVVFDDCIKTWKQACLKKEEEHLIALLSLADEENNQEKIMELTNQLMEVQKKRKIQQ
jgi:DNA primase